MKNDKWNTTARDCLPGVGVPVLVLLGKEGELKAQVIARLKMSRDGFGDERPDCWQALTPVHKRKSREVPEAGWRYKLIPDGDVALSKGVRWMPLPEVTDE